MKRSIVAVILLISAAILYGQPVQRQNVLVEIGTGTWCGFCVGASLGAGDLIDHGHDVAVIKYHKNDAFSNLHSEARINYYEIEGYPTAKFDGIVTYTGGDPYSSIYHIYLPLYEQRIEVPSPFTIAVYFENTGGLSYDANVLVKQVCDNYVASDLVLHFAITETDIPYSWQGLTHITYALRAMVPDTLGTPLDFSASDEQMVNLSFSLDAGWAGENINLVAFVQDVPSKEVFQTNIVSLESTFSTVTFNVKDDEGNDITGAIATLDVFENSPGDYVFEKIPGGEYEYKVEKAGYITVEDEILVEQDVTVNVTMFKSNTVTFAVTDITGNEITDAVATFDGVENPPGDYVFENIKAGTYYYMVEKEGYETFEGEVTLDNDITIEAVMLPYFTVIFDIADTEGKPVENCVVTLGSVENPPGDYVFENVAYGEYDYKVEKMGYYTVEDSIMVEDDVTVEVVMEAIPVFTVTFVVSCKLYGEPLAGAVVLFDNDMFFTGNDGKVAIEDVLPGEYYYSVFKQDYITHYGMVNVDYEDTEVIVELVIGEDPEFDVVFNVTDEDGDAIENAVLTFDEEEYSTCANGQVLIENVVIGTYEYIVTKPGYLPEEGIAEVWNENVVIDVTLLAELFTLMLSACPKEAGIVYGEGEYKSGDEVTISVESTCECWHFCCWYGDTEHVDDIYSTTPTVTMPAKDITLTASFCINTVKEISRVNIIVFPNPTHNNFTVRSNEMIKQIRLVSIGGQVVKDMAVNELSTDINVSNLHPGVYFIQIHTAGSIITERVQITR